MINLPVLIITGLCLSLGAGFIVLVMKLRFISRQLENPKKNIRLTTYFPLLSKIVRQINKTIDNYNQLEIKQKKFDKVRRNFLSTVSHDIRTPLTSIIGYLDALKDDFAENKLLNPEYLEIAGKKSRQLKRRIDQFFDFAKLQGDHWQMNPEKIDAAEAIREIMIGFLPRLEKKAIYHDLKLGQTPVFIWFDKLSFTRIMENLIQNILLHAGDGGYLGIELHRQDEIVTLSVSDKGAGFSPEQLDRLFTRHQSMTGSHRSGGLGLSIVYELCQKNNAQIKVYNTRGIGVVFTITMTNVS